jgi:hypothetical protein
LSRKKRKREKETEVEEETEENIPGNKLNEEHDEEEWDEDMEISEHQYEEDGEESWGETKGRKGKKKRGRKNRKGKERKNREQKRRRKRVRYNSSEERIKDAEDDVEKFANAVMEGDDNTGQALSRVNVVDVRFKDQRILALANVPSLEKMIQEPAPIHIHQAEDDLALERHVASCSAGGFVPSSPRAARVERAKQKAVKVKTVKHTHLIISPAQRQKFLDLYEENGDTKDADWYRFFLVIYTDASKFDLLYFTSVGKPEFWRTEYRVWLVRFNLGICPQKLHIWAVLG